MHFWVNGFSQDNNSARSSIFFEHLGPWPVKSGMSTHYSVCPQRFDIEFRPASKTSTHGGQLATIALLEQFGLCQKIQQRPALETRRDDCHGFDPEVYVLSFLVALTSGGISLADVERLNEDEPLKAFLGIKKFPDQSALGEWLRHLGHDGWLALRQIGREFVAWTLQQAQPNRYLQAGRLELFFDDTQIEVSGPWFQGAAINYEGHWALSWQTLWVGPLVVDHVLGATSPTKESASSDAPGRDVSNQLPGLLETNRAIWESFNSYLYADSASSAGAYLQSIAEHCRGWSVSYNKWTGPLEQKAQELPESQWSEVESVRWRDGSEHTAQYGWFRYQPGGCESPQVFAVVRHRAADELLWRHAFVTCEDRTGTAQAVFERHRLKGDWERRLSELLSDLDLHHPPCQDLMANRCFYALATLGYNVLQALQMIHLPAEQAARRIRTLIRHLLLVPVEMVRHARRLKACLYVPAGWVAWWRGLLGELLPRWRQLGQVGPSG